MDETGASATGSSFTFDGTFENWELTDYADQVTVQSAPSSSSFQSLTEDPFEVTIAGRDGNDHYIERAEDAITKIDESTAAGGGGDDTYDVTGSTVEVTDDSGDDTVDFGSKTNGVTLTLDDEGGEATGSFFRFTGFFESIFGGSGPDNFTLETTMPQTVDGGPGTDIFEIKSFTGTIEDADAEFVFSAFAGSTPGPNCPVNGLCLELTNTGGTMRSGDGSVDLSLAGSVQNIIGSAFDDIIDFSASSVSRTVQALGGDDVINAGTGADEIDGGPGNDQMSGSGGNDKYNVTPGSDDVIIDTSGIDTVDFSAASLGIRYDLDKQNGEVQELDSADNTLAVTGTLENVIATQFVDHIWGNSQANYIVGLDGDDKLFGEGGNDLLIGGRGADRLEGNAGEDIVIGGYTIYDLNDAALRAIVAEWSSNSPLQTRVTNLRTGVPVAGGSTARLSASVNPTVFHDNDKDRISGNSGADWLFFDDEDRITSLNSEDITNDDLLPTNEDNGGRKKRRR